MVTRGHAEVAGGRVEVPAVTSCAVRVAVSAAVLRGDGEAVQRADGGRLAPHLGELQAGHRIGS